MSTFINIETATELCSCSLSIEDKVVIDRVNHNSQSHATSLGVFVEETMQFVREKQLNINAVSVSSGPGSYTGLRIGVSQAKGLSYGLNIPLIAIPTTAIMAYAVKDEVDDDVLLCPMIDARRMEVYTTIYNTSLQVVRETAAEILDQNSYSDILSKTRVCFFGNGSQKFKEVIDHPNAIFIDEIKPLASSMCRLTKESYDTKKFTNSAYFEPFYLKEFNATIPKNKILSR